MISRKSKWKPSNLQQTNTNEDQLFLIMLSKNSQAKLWLYNLILVSSNDFAFCLTCTW